MMATFLLSLRLFSDKEDNYDNSVVNYIYIHQGMRSWAGSLHARGTHYSLSIFHIFSNILLIESLVVLQNRHKLVAPSALGVELSCRGRFQQNSRKTNRRVDKRPDQSSGAHRLHWDINCKSRIRFQPLSTPPQNPEVKNHNLIWASVQRGRGVGQFETLTYRWKRVKILVSPLLTWDLALLCWLRWLQSGN